MARISTYPVDQNPDGTDVLLGTDSTGGVNATKNFRISDISIIVIQEWLLNTNWVFNIDASDAAFRKSQLYFSVGGGDKTTWANITTLRATLMMKNNSDSEKYLRYLLTNDPVTGKPAANNQIKIHDRDDLSSFGIFEFTSLTLVPNETFIYDLGLTYVNGSGTIQSKHVYGIDTNTIIDTFKFIQGVPSTTWVVAHNLNKFPSITVVDSAGTVVTGQYAYTDNNNVTLTFSAAFAGKAYLN